jgi:hypothetical protein
MNSSPPIFELPIHGHIRERLREFHSSGKIPHLIFHGSNGSGKRTLVDEFLNLIYDCDKNKIKTNVMYVNCAHGKGIKFIREELKFFAKTNIKLNTGVIFKTIVLLNADNLTIDAQSALRRCIELFSVNTRFFIIVENKHKLLNPILSRFCEIYVPEVCENGQVLNLHQYKVAKTFGFGDIEQRKMDDIENILEPVLREFGSSMKMGGNGVAKYRFLHQERRDKTVDHILLNALVTEMYERGLSCLDYMNWIDRVCGKAEAANIQMCFHKIKSEFRCEKILLCYMLDYTFLRSDTSLKNLGFL